MNIILGAGTFLTASALLPFLPSSFNLLLLSHSKILFLLNLHLFYDRYTTLKNKITEMQIKFQKGALGNRLNKNPANIYLFKVNNR